MLSSPEKPKISMKSIEISSKSLIFHWFFVQEKHEKHENQCFGVVWSFFQLVFIDFSTFFAELKILFLCY